jgi:hypothetical protein
MVRIAHIIHPVIVDETSDLVVAQPITLETMRLSKEMARDTSNVSLYAVQYHDEERIRLPDCFIRTPDLTRSIADIKTFKTRKKLALIGDILDALYNTSRADYFIYTNVDIALMPGFYLFVTAMIERGHDAFVINRRTISDHHTLIKEIPFMYAEIGEPHKGYDCFIFKRDVYPRYRLGNICIGTAWIGRILLANMLANASRFREFRKEHLTFHIGDPCPWRGEEFADYLQENLGEYRGLFTRIEAERGAFNPILRSYLLDTGDARIIPDFETYYNPVVPA